MQRDVSRPQRNLWRDALAQNGRQRAQVRLIRQEVLNSVMGRAVIETVQAIPNDKLCLELAFKIGAWHASAHP